MDDIEFNTVRNCAKSLICCTKKWTGLSSLAFEALKLHVAISERSTSLDCKCTLEDVSRARKGLREAMDCLREIVQEMHEVCAKGRDIAGTMGWIQLKEDEVDLINTMQVVAAEYALQLDVQEGLCAAAANGSSPLHVWDLQAHVDGGQVAALKGIIDRTQ